VGILGCGCCGGGGAASSFFVVPGDDDDGMNCVIGLRRHNNFRSYIRLGLRRRIHIQNGIPNFLDTCIQ
jgi:hypothetical protein